MTTNPRWTQLLKVYFTVLALLTTIVVVLGFALPYLISARSHELPLIGVGVAVVALPLCLLLLAKAINAIGSFTSNQETKS